MNKLGRRSRKDEISGRFLGGIVTGSEIDICLFFAVILWSVLSEWLADGVVLTSQVILSVIVYACIKINFSVLLLTHQP